LIRNDGQRRKDGRKQTAENNLVVIESFAIDPFAIENVSRQVWIIELGHARRNGGDKGMTNSGQTASIPFIE
jgi:hypothetical protein